VEAFMMSPRLYEDVQRRLNNSILFYGGVPKYTRYHTGNNIQLYDIVEYGVLGRDAPAITVPYTDSLVEARAPQLGYVNYPNAGAHFITRSTMRDQRMGLPVEAISSNTIAYIDSSYIYHQAFVDMLLNKYPSMTEAYKMLSSMTGRNNKCAFSKNYALNSRLNIFHQDRVIGTLVKDEVGEYSVSFVGSIRHVSFYRRNLCERFAGQIGVFKT
jgi:hypothetical protein